VRKEVLDSLVRWRGGWCTDGTKEDKWTERKGAVGFFKIRRTGGKAIRPPKKRGEGGWWPQGKELLEEVSRIWQTQWIKNEKGKKPILQSLACLRGVALAYRVVDQQRVNEKPCSIRIQKRRREKGKRGVSGAR